MFDFLSDTVAAVSSVASEESAQQKKRSRGEPGAEPKMKAPRVPRKPKAKRKESPQIELAETEAITKTEPDFTLVSMPTMSVGAAQDDEDYDNL